MTARRMRAALAVTATSLAGLALGAGPAQAAFTTPEFQTMLTGAGDHQIGHATGIAVDEQAHDIYVADAMYHRVEKFDSEGNFILMFGDGVDQTTGGDVCTAASHDVCREGQQSSPTYPPFAYPRSIAVDNSNDASRGDVYVADNGGDGSVSKFDSEGHLITSWGEDGRKYLGVMQMGVSSYTGYLWVLGTEQCQFSVFDEHGTESLRFPQRYNCGRFGDLGVDEHDNVYFASYYGVILKTNASHELEGLGELGVAYEGAVDGYAINPANGDILIDLGEEVVVLDKTCDPSLGYCAAKEKFGAGQITGGEGLAIDSESGSVYVATSSGVAYFKPKVIPDVVPNGPALAGHTGATLSQHIDPLGAGPVTECEVEYGRTKSYGSSVPCEQSTPISAPTDVTASLSGLTAETTYHYRFLAKDADGVSYGPDQLVTPHWVKNLLTGEATGVGPGGATLHGSLNPNGETTHYYFEWGPTTSYGNKTPAEPGADPGTGSSDVPVEVSLGGQLTSETTYHYRIVGYSDLGLSDGVDQTFTTPIAELPVIQEPAATGVGLAAATVGAEVNPGFGETSFLVQYSAGESFDTATVISPAIGDDGTFHHVSAELSELSPGTTYHYRIIAFNFKGTVKGPVATFTTPEVPAVTATSATVLGPESVRLSAQVLSNAVSGSPSVHFAYGPTEAYGSRTAEIPPTASEDGSSTIELSGLTPGTTYHFQAVATNAFGSSSSADGTFVTAAAHGSSTGPPGGTSCKKGQVRKKGRCVAKPHRKTRHGHRNQHGRGARS